jgi:hypothetical protein
MQRQWRFGPVAIVIAAVAGLLQPSDSVRAQPASPQRPPSAAAPSAPATPAPYKAVAITLPETLKDPGFEALRKELAGIAQRKDRAALARLTVQKGFFWERETGNGADPKKSGIANFAAAIGLDSPDDPETGWDMIMIYAEDATVFGLSDKPGVVCGPADPGFNEDEFQALLTATKTDVSDWIYPIKPGIDLRSASRPNAPVAEKVGLTFIRVMATDAPPDTANPAEADLLRVMLPSGKTGFVKGDEIASLGVSQICYVKEGGAWKITGVLGGVE